MKPKSNVLFSVFSTLIVFALLLAACPAPTQPVDTPPEEPVAVEPTERVRVVWWEEATDDVYREMLLEEFVASFNAAYDDIELEFLFQEDMNRVVRTALAAGAAPDIFHTPGPSYVLEYVLAGFVHPLDEYAQQFGWRENILPWAYESGMVEGKLYSLPLTYETMVLYYNKTVFDEHGWTPPTNRAELEKLCEDIHDAGMICFSNSNATWKGVNEWLVGVFYSNYAGADNVYKALNQERQWDDPVFIEAVQLLKDYMDRGWFMGGRENYFSVPDTWSPFCEGQALMKIEGTWGFQNAPEFCDESGQEWDWAPLPPLREGVETGFDLAIGATISIYSGSENPEAAARVVDWVFNDQKRAARIAESFNFGEWLVPLDFDREDFSPEADERFMRYIEEFEHKTGQGKLGYTTWTFWPVRTMNHIIEQLDAVFTGDLSVEEYNAEQQRIYAEEFAAGQVPPAPATQIETQE